MHNHVDKKVEGLSKITYFLEVIPGRCRGCSLCELVCSLVHEGEVNPNASRIKIEKDRESYKFTTSVCLQCISPKCMYACPTDAIKVERKIGAKIIDEELCVNCGLCAEACPFNSDGNIIFQHPSNSVYIKCDLCFFRENGPACIDVCSTQAIVLKKVIGGMK